MSENGVEVHLHHQIHQRARLLGQEGDGSECGELNDVGGQCLIGRERCHADGTPLAVRNPVDFLSGDLNHVFQRSGYVVFRHGIEIPIPELALRWLEGFVRTVS